MHVDICFLSVKRAGAHANSCSKTVWGLCWCNFSPNSLLWGSLLGKKTGRDMFWPRPWSLSAMCPLVSTLSPLWPRLQTLSAMCPWCVRLASALWVRFGRAPKTCPPSLRLVSRLVVSSLGSALAAPPNLVRHVSVMCPPCVRPLSPLWPRPKNLSAISPPCVPPCCVQPWVRFGRASKPCPPCVRDVSALCPPFESTLAAPQKLVRHLSALCPALLCPALGPLWPRLQTLSAMCPWCVRLVSALWLWPRLQTLSAMCLPCLLSAMCPPKCSQGSRGLSAMSPPCSP